MRSASSRTVRGDSPTTASTWTRRWPNSTMRASNGVRTAARSGVSDAGNTSATGTLPRKAARSNVCPLLVGARKSGAMSPMLRWVVGSTRCSSRSSGSVPATPAWQSVTCRISRFEGVGENLEAPGEQSGHVHLADPDPFGDLALGHLLEVPEIHDPAVALGELLEHGPQCDAGLGVGERVVLAAETVGHGAAGLAA